jgi:peptidoglycan/xylan/chitin deacetylase (PgdA/CDA1 family)
VETGQDFWTERLARLLYPIELNGGNVLILNKFLPMDSLNHTELSRTEFINLATIALKNHTHERIEEILNELEQEPAFKHNHIRTERSMCSWHELREMAESNLITIGSHTLSHAILTNENERRQSEEVVRSKRILEKKIGSPIHHFAYPNGNFNDATEKIVRDAGYHSACNCLNGANGSDTSPYRIRRIHVFDRKDDGVAFSEFRFSVRISDLYQQLKRVRNSLLKQAY